MATAPIPVGLSAKTSIGVKNIISKTKHDKPVFFMIIPSWKTQPNWVYYNLRYIKDATVNPMKKSTPSFADTVKQCKDRIRQRRQDLNTLEALAEKIIDANCPYEYRPSGEPTHGVLLIHGLLDCPFSLRDIGQHLAAAGMLVRSVLLPGHGTRPDDLMHIKYQDWITVVHEAIAALKQETGKVTLVGYSTGAALSVYEALFDQDIASLVLLSPAIKVKVPVNVVVTWHTLTSVFSKQKGWLCKEEEIDYAKYLSVPFNAVHQVNALTDVVREQRKKTGLTTPIFMVISREDETISSHHAIAFFESLPNPLNRMLLYSARDHRYPDKRITTRLAHYPTQGINHLSHTSIPFSPNNPHYGQHGDYLAASHPHHEEVLFGAYNRIEVDLFNLLYNLGLTAHKRRELTYNPDFDYMMRHITKFIENS